jgi:tetratricopeptide (TPR) repeat protein
MGFLAMGTALALLATADCGWGQANYAPAVKAEYSARGTNYFAQEDATGAVAAAEKALAADPKNVELILALGRAQAGIWQFRDAIATYTRGLALAPDDARFLVARGHRYLSTRQFARARADLERAARLDPKAEGLWYHLGLVHYLTGEFEKAAAAFEKSRDGAADDTARVGPTDWMYMSLRRAGKTAEAAKVLESISADMKIAGNENLYYSRLLLYKGVKTEAELEIPAPSTDMAAELRAATLAYGLGNWHLYNGNPARARDLFQRAIATRAWPAFGFICAEADLARMK